MRKKIENKIKELENNIELANGMGYLGAIDIYKAQIDVLKEILGKAKL